MKPHDFAKYLRRNPAEPLPWRELRRAVVIPAVFLPLACLFCGGEAGLLAAVLTGLMVSRHYHGLGRILRGEEPRKFRPGKSE